jgi:cell wall-associated NlpC family hydrolase
VRAVPKTRPLLLAALLALAAGAGPSAAQEADDAIGSLLSQRGLAPAVQAATQVRDAAGELVLTAMTFLDVRYRRGGDSAEEGFDCSGFTRHVVESVLGLSLPRRSAEQAQQAGLSKVAREELQPGDLVFFNTLRRTFSHVGIYIGEGRFIHAPRSGKQIRVERIEDRYWARRFDGARRVVGEAAATP